MLLQDKEKSYIKIIVGNQPHKPNVNLCLDFSLNISQYETMKFEIQNKLEKSLGQNCIVIQLFSKNYQSGNNNLQLITCFQNNNENVKELLNIISESYAIDVKFHISQNKIFFVLQSEILDSFVQGFTDQIHKQSLNTHQKNQFTFQMSSDTIFDQIGTINHNTWGFSPYQLFENLLINIEFKKTQRSRYLLQKISELIMPSLSPVLKIYESFKTIKLDLKLSSTKILPKTYRQQNLVYKQVEKQELFGKLKSVFALANAKIYLFSKVICANGQLQVNRFWQFLSRALL